MLQMIDGEKMREARKAAGLSQIELAKRIGVSQQLIGQLENSKNGTSKKIYKIARILNVFVSNLDPDIPLNGDNNVPVVGYVGAGAETHFYSGGDNPEENADAAPGSNENTVAVEIRGTSLGPMFDRALVYYDEKRDPPTSDMLRKLCVVGLSDGRVLVKQLLSGSIQGRFHLLSQTEGMIENVVVEWAAVVRAIVPR